ncbi:EAL domain-containing protein [Methylobacillus gramineus]|uniref:bifunctional diguanylate cyclase/phosphodiesterase n=1 Tax=Methylobacillus gramineus TaxID=755169 RepID=UPI001CFF6E9C|nr:EAL domain-containing protein [Methylobacillus gramineus]MCB5185140.1 EAL domain-containing protein [Methylobacillus gramineus]
MSFNQAPDRTVWLGFWCRYSPMIIALSLGIMLGMLTIYLDRVEQEVALKDERAYIATITASVRARLEAEINSAIHLGLGLATYIAANPQASEKDFQRISAKLIKYGRHVKAITLAPDNVVRHVYPLSGNEKVLGLRYHDSAPEQDSLHPMRAWQFTLAGPINLIQGGRGLVHRLPVFLGEEPTQESYWGVVSVVLDIDSLLNAAGLTAPQTVVQYALRRSVKPGTANLMVYGDSALFNHHPILLDVSLSDSLPWQLAAVPLHGWGTLTERQLWIRLFGGGLSLILTVLIYVWLKSVQRLRVRNAQARLATSVLAYSNECILIANSYDEVVTINPAVSKITGYQPADLVGMPSGFLLAEPMQPEEMKQMQAMVSHSGNWQTETWFRHKGGHIFPVALTVTAVHDEHNRTINFVNTFSDISERKRAEERIYNLAHQDALTGLPNRIDIYGRLEELMKLADNQHRFAAMILDLDNFKIINDTLGHYVGDQLLVEVAHRLTSAVNSGDVVARLGGDEFVVVLTNVDAPVTVSNVAEKILYRLAQTYLIDGYELHSSASIGIGVFPRDGVDINSLFKNVDTAMYEAKSQGKGNYQFFTESMRVQIDERLRMESYLRQAIARQEFVLHYQPQIDIASGRVSGVEALVRWNHPELGMVYPDKFIKIAEECNLIIPLGEWVLQEACRQSSEWRAQGMKDICMSVNISARQLQSRLLFSLIDHLIAQYDIKPGALELEITESVAMDNPEETIPRMEKLRAKGVALAIDDFGTGYSSLSYLKLLPLTRLKIDRSFVKDIESDPNDAAICAATIALAHILDLELVAEGVETEAQLQYLREQGCDTAQGYYFSKPLPADSLVEFVSCHQAVMTG